MNRPGAVIVVATTDLMVSSQISAAIDQTGCVMKVIPHRDAIVDLVEHADCAGIIVDLSASTFSPLELIEALPVERPPVVAFGPHVHKQKLDDARDAGCEQVLSRGQFLSSYAEIVSGFVQ